MRAIEREALAILGKSGAKAEIRDFAAGKCVKLEISPRNPVRI
jgi:hypothetical protein